ncbi:DsbA family protein [Sporolactobacillus shoreae]|uniref:ClpXP adapter protein SpxH n=1 Tax=Sporolactobacillus shoreae TaxID=1465501 RepID=A0A4Z0GKA4_9BACL|nr:DsbA family protein [Sporolactobacillus shoreae]TGA95976.1 DsbA family protein [Sporolactobacillus shoreae]
MTLHDKFSYCVGAPGNTTCSIGNHSQQHSPRVEILAFIDPLCPECWGLEPLMKKFFIEYHEYFTFRFLLTTKHDTTNRCQFTQAKKIAEEWNKYARLTGMCCDSDVWYENPPSPYAVALAIKAAGFQGKTAGNRFLRRIREQIFLRKKGLNRFEELLDVARLAELDINEFNNDFHSCRSVKALQCDRRLANEMSITELPSLVFSTPCNDDEAIKVNGHYDYGIYVQILTELLEERPQPAPLPTLSDYFSKEIYLTTKEVSVIYEWSEDEAMKELRKLQLKQIIEPIELRSGEFWRYITAKQA